MGMGSNDHSWAALNVDPQLPTFNSPDPSFAFDTTAFGLQNEQSPSFSFTSTDCGFNLLSPTFNSVNHSFDMPDLGQFSASDSTSIVTNNDPFSVPSMVAPALVNASQSSQFIGASSFMQFQPTTAPPLALVNASQPSQFIGASFMQFQPTIAPAPAFPHTGALLPSPSPSNASSPTVVPQAGNAPQHIPAASNALPQSTATPVSPPSHGQSSQPAAAPSDASSPPPAQNTASSQHAQAAAITTPLSPSLNSDLAHSQLADNPETSALSSVPLIQASDGRRSGRNPVPSKRHEQMNEIDGKAQIKSTASAAAGHIEKENIPSTTPEWTIAAYDHLLKSDLGKDWTTCVQAWFELEQELGYGSRAKVCLLIFFSSLAGFNFVL